MTRALFEAGERFGPGLGPVHVVPLGEGETLPQGNREEELEGSTRNPVVREDGLEVAARRPGIAPPDRERGPLPEGREVAIPLAEGRVEAERFLERRLGFRQGPVLGFRHGEVVQGVGPPGRLPRLFACGPEERPGLPGPPETEREVAGGEARVGRERVRGRVLEGGGHGPELPLRGRELLPPLVELGAKEVEPGAEGPVARGDRVEQPRGVLFPAEPQEEVGPREPSLEVRLLREQRERLSALAEAGQETSGPFAPAPRLGERRLSVDACRGRPRLLHPPRQGVTLHAEERLAEIRSRGRRAGEERGGLLRPPLADGLREAPPRFVQVGSRRAGGEAREDEPERIRPGSLEARQPRGPLGRAEPFEEPSPLLVVREPVSVPGGAKERPRVVRFLQDLRDPAGRSPCRDDRLGDREPVPEERRGTQDDVGRGGRAPRRRGPRGSGQERTRPLPRGTQEPRRVSARL